MKSFVVANGTPTEFIGRVRRELAIRGLDHIVTLEGDDSRLTVRMRWMGTTELRYRLESADQGFRALLENESVSPLHAPFRHAFDERLEAVLEKVGAKTLNV